MRALFYIKLNVSFPIPLPVYLPVPLTLLSCVSAETNMLMCFRLVSLFLSGVYSLVIIKKQEGLNALEPKIF